MMSQTIQMAFSLINGMTPTDPNNFIFDKLMEIEKSLTDEDDIEQFGYVWEAYEANL